MQNLRVLHICSDYAKQRLYRNLVVALDGQKIEQIVYVPVRSEREINNNLPIECTDIQFRFAHVLRLYHRVFFRSKVAAVVADLMNNIDVEKCALIHAHFLFSDGAVARRLQRKFGTPYIVAVRNTDINVFMKYRPDLRWLCWDILRNAAQVVFLSPLYEAKLKGMVPPDLRADLDKKSRVIPNGLDHYWLENTNSEERFHNELRLLYVGDFSRNKNIMGSIEATGLLNEGTPTTLTLAGDGGDGEQMVDDLLAREECAFVSRIGRIDDHVQLRAIYGAHDILVMPSFFETFGVTYVEALSQGLPVVHSRGQGVDGYFPEGSVAEAVDPSDPVSIVEGIRKLSERLPGLREQCVHESQRFGWDLISGNYKDLYVDIAREQSK